MEYPTACIETGLNCESCTQATARELARACPNLPARSVTQLFVQIYTHPACSRMHGNFARAYAETPKKPAALSLHRVAAAVA